MKWKMSRKATAFLPAAVLVTALLACNGFKISLTTATSPVEPTAASVQTELPTTAGETVVPTTEPVPPVAESTPTYTSTPIVHVLVPGEPPASFLSEVTDRDTSSMASQRRALGGENFSTDFYERPFNANTMDTYFPDLDILRARVSRDSQWFFADIKLAGQDPAGGLTGAYGLEIDLNVDGRGDVLLMAVNPGGTWSTDGVRAWQDGNHDVGAAHPIGSDGPLSGDGYETLLFDSGVGADADAAWARIAPSDPNSVQIAFKRSLIGDDGIFTWGAWAMNASMLNPAWFDYNDHFTLAEAGSPLSELTEFYPLKAFAEADNTCRWGVGFTPTGSEPGVCPVPPTPMPTTISGLIWFDFDYDGTVDAPLDYGYPSTSVRVRTGSCGSPGATVATISTNASGNYFVTVYPGTFCVDVPAMPASANISSGPVTVTVNVGDHGVANVRFSYELR